MKTETINYNLLDEDFEIPDCNIDLQETIEQAIEYYNVMPLMRRETKAFKFKLNELIDTYNERRQMRIYNHI